LRVLCCLLPLSLIPPAHATGRDSAAFAGFTEAERVRALIDLARDGRNDLVTAHLAKYPLTGRFAANRTLFIKGLVLKAEGHLPAAVEKYEQALTHDPSLAMVRAELAHTFYLLGEKARARREFELLKTDVPANQADEVSAVIEAIDRGQPVSVNTGFEPSADVETHAIGGIAFEIQDAPEDGIGFASGIDAAYSEELDRRLATVIGRGSRALQYESLSSTACKTAISRHCEEFSVSETAEIRYKTEAGYLGFSALSSLGKDGADEQDEWVQFGRDDSSWALGPRFTLFHAIAPDLALTGDVTFLRQDGWKTSAEGGLGKVFSSDLAAYASGGFEQFSSDESDDLSYWSFFGGVGVYKELPWNLSTKGQIEAKRRFYGSDGVSDPGAPRRDLELGTSVSLWKRDFSILGYSPVVEYSFAWNGSNIGIFDYTSHVFDLRLTKEF
jgi:tetratricopeptide (TPR) repeat protein